MSSLSLFVGIFVIAIVFVVVIVIVVVIVVVVVIVIVVVIVVVVVVVVIVVFVVIVMTNNHNFHNFGLSCLFTISICFSLLQLRVTFLLQSVRSEEIYDLDLMVLEALLVLVPKWTTSLSPSDNAEALPDPLTMMWLILMLIPADEDPSLIVFSRCG